MIEIKFCKKVFIYGTDNKNHQSNIYIFWRWYKVTAVDLSAINDSRWKTNKNYKEETIRHCTRHVQPMKGKYQCQSKVEAYTSIRKKKIQDIGYQGGL